MRLNNNNMKETERINMIILYLNSIMLTAFLAYITNLFWLIPMAIWILGFITFLLKTKEINNEPENNESG